MIEALILIGAMCVLAVVIDHFRAFDVSAFSVAMFARGDQIVDLRGGRYRVVRTYAHRDTLRVRRTLR